LLPATEVADAFTDDIVTDAPAFDTAMKSSDCVLKNYFYYKFLLLIRNSRQNLVGSAAGLVNTIWAHSLQIMVPSLMAVI